MLPSEVEPLAREIMAERKTEHDARYVGPVWLWPAPSPMSWYLDLSWYLDQLGDA